MINNNNFFFFSILFFILLTYFLITKSKTRKTLVIKAAIIGPTTQTIPGSWPLFVTDTSGLPSTGLFGFGLLGGSPGGTSRISKERYSENGDDVNKCCGKKLKIS